LKEKKQKNFDKERISRAQNERGAGTMRNRVISLEAGAEAPAVLNTTFTQYDSGPRRLTVRLLDGGRPFRIPAGASVEFNFALPDGRRLSREAAIKDAGAGLAVCGLDRDALSEAGVASCSASVLKNDARRTWRGFIFAVAKSLADLRPVEYAGAAAGRAIVGLAVVGEAA
jgi:hypothetical protein